MKIDQLPILDSNDSTLNRAFRVAIGDICSNLVSLKAGQLEQPETCLAAGLNYPTLWTRDNAVNTAHFTGLFLPEVGENSLRAVLEKDTQHGGWRIGGQYWDAIIWLWGAWAYYLYRGDKSFLHECLDIAERSLSYFEDTEFDPETGLFRGPAFFQDGISGYPDELSNNFGSDIRDWIKANSDKKHPVGFGIPWFSLSTNCLYVNGYQTINLMRNKLDLARSAEASQKANALKNAIHREFWNKRRGTFDYLRLPDGRTCKHQEGAGLAFAILFDVATDEQIASMLRTVQRTPAGIPCIWPQFPRFSAFAGDHYGRHSGTVWPQVQSLWALAALKAKAPFHFFSELDHLAKHAVRDGHFTEIYHPMTGEEYGGIQEHWENSSIQEWESVPHTCWGATSFIALIHKGLLGLDYTSEGLAIRPNLPGHITSLELANIPYRESNLRVKVSGSGSTIKSCTINGQQCTPFISTDAAGETSVELVLA